MRTVSAVVGNPRGRSKTADLATIFVDTIARQTSWEARPIVEVADLAANLHSDDRSDLERAFKEVMTADVLVVASPTYQATYTGLLKVFLESLPKGALESRVVLPIMLAGSERHALAVRNHLAPLLTEMQAHVIGPLFIHEQELNDLRQIAEAWWTSNGPALVAVAASREDRA